MEYYSFQPIKGTFLVQFSHDTGKENANGRLYRALLWNFFVNAGPLFLTEYALCAIIHTVFFESVPETDMGSGSGRSPRKERNGMRVVIQENYVKMCKWAADYIAARIRAHNMGDQKDRPFVLGLPTGSSPVGVYRELVRQNRSGELSFANVVTFNMDEYLNLPREHDQSYWYFMHENFFNHLVDMKPENIHILNGMAEDPEKECREYEEQIASFGGIDLFMGGIGVDGHIAFNEPFTSLNSRTGVRDLTTDTRIVNSRFFGGDPEAVPAQALSVGVGTVFDSKEVLILINGHAIALAATVEGSVSSRWTCSTLQMHNNAIIACDEAACGEMTVDAYKYFLDIEKKERL